MNQIYSGMNNNMQSQIDFVLPWVDGSDRNWLNNRIKWQSKESIDSELNSKARFRDYGTLKYVFRSIEKYCPWVRRVYFITEHQVPDWLDKSNSKLFLVNHEDFIPKEFLPTFNSSVILTNIHRIKGISEQFVVLNDDFFFNSPLKPSIFFRNGLPCDSSEFDPVHPSGDTFSHIILNDLELVAKYFTKKNVTKNNRWKYYTPKIGMRALIKNLLLLPYKDLLGYKNFHLPSPYLKSSFGELWKLEEDKLRIMDNNKFREITDVNEWVFRYWRLSQGSFYPINLTRFGGFYKIDEITNIVNDIKKSKHAMICINDTQTVEDDIIFNKLTDILNTTFEVKFPNKSRFEK